MLLLHVVEWLGAGRNHPDQHTLKATERHIGMVTEQPLESALRHLKAHETAYKARYLLAVEFRVLAVSRIDDLSDEMIDSGMFERLDALGQKPEDLGFK